ncbi:phage tail sheath family protein [Hymenobacter psoromatis]|uniref:phage tail sheath family protein n=1 Tax=Hymenobacter psoromatis TaxID=1484116 RepID=UPI001CC1A8D2
MATAVPAFIGYTQQAQKLIANDLHLLPTRIKSLLEYEQLFGGPQPETGLTVTIREQQDAAGHPLALSAAASLAVADRSRYLLHYALQLYFGNGGGPCYLVSVGAYQALGTALVASELVAGLQAVRAFDEPTLLVFPEAQLLADIADFKLLHDLALAQCAQLQDRFVVLDVHGGDVSLLNPEASLLTAIGNFRAHGVGTENLSYGAAYAPNLDTALPFLVDENQTDVQYFLHTNAAVTTKLSALASSNPPRYQQALTAIRGLPCRLPPSAALAGIYAAVDSQQGVWKAPANVAINYVTKLTHALTDAELTKLTVDAASGKSVNAIRAFAGKGTLVWGARTLAGNDNEWRYVSVRRLFLFVRESVQKGIASFGFAPNDAATWMRVQATVENFLNLLWRQGALQGAKPAQAFYVVVGLGKTMTAADILAGRLVVEMGLAAVRPAEFSIIRIILPQAAF